MDDFTNWDSILVSYYDDTDYYAPTSCHVHHVDLAMERTKQFTRGNFYFPNVDHLIECKNNCGIDVKVIKEGFGRYCIRTNVTAKRRHSS